MFTFIHSDKEKECTVMEIYTLIHIHNIVCVFTIMCVCVKPFLLV